MQDIIELYNSLPKDSNDYILLRDLILEGKLEIQEERNFFGKITNRLRSPEEIKEKMGNRKIAIENEEDNYNGPDTQKIMEVLSNRDLVRILLGNLKDNLDQHNFHRICRVTRVKISENQLISNFYENIDTYEFLLSPEKLNKAKNKVKKMAKGINFDDCNSIDSTFFSRTKFGNFYLKLLIHHYVRDGKEFSLLNRCMKSRLRENQYALLIDQLFRDENPSIKTMFLYLDSFSIDNPMTRIDLMYFMIIFNYLEKILVENKLKKDRQKINEIVIEKLKKIFETPGKNNFSNENLTFSLGDNGALKVEDVEISENMLKLFVSTKLFPLSQETIKNRMSEYYFNVFSPSTELNDGVNLFSIFVNGSFQNRSIEKMEAFFIKDVSSLNKTSLYYSINSHCDKLIPFLEKHTSRDNVSRNLTMKTLRNSIINECDKEFIKDIVNRFISSHTPEEILESINSDSKNRPIDVSLSNNIVAFCEQLFPVYEKLANIKNIVVPDHLFSAIDGGCSNSFIKKIFEYPGVRSKFSQTMFEQIARNLDRKNPKDAELINFFEKVVN